jgi:hypothetical protein
MRHWRRQPFLAQVTATLAAAGCSAAIASAPATREIPALPDRVDDSTFWSMVTAFSEPDGYFASDNFVSNEGELQYVIPELLRINGPGGVYVGVGPEQNFTYIAAVRPRIAFICDIRRQNFIEHLMYKALLEMSADRAGFLAHLWSRPRPAGLDSTTTADTLAARFLAVAPDSLMFRSTYDAMLEQLVDVHGFALSSADSVSLRFVFSAFYSYGPEISYSSRVGPFPGPSGRGRTIVWGGDSLGLRTTVYDSLGQLRVIIAGGLDTTIRLQRPNRLPLPAYASMSMMPTFSTLMAEDDGAGVQRGWLASEAAFRTVKDLEARNLVIPVVGDFSGPLALRSIGSYVRSRGAKVDYFYVSNVEQYLFQSDAWQRFYANVAAMPWDSTSSFIRSVSNTRWVPLRNRRSRMAQVTSSIDAVISAHEARLLTAYNQVVDLRRR